MLTKGIIQSMSTTGNRCVVRMPLFENAGNASPVQATALVNITPGIFNNLAVGDVVFVGFEENALEKPVILGKLFTEAISEANIRGGGGVFNSLKVNNDAVIPSSTLFIFPENIKKEYENLKTPKKVADYIKWLERFTKETAFQLDDNFRCFKNWTQWQLQANNVEIDDGDLDEDTPLAEPFLNQEENSQCAVCGNNKCTKNGIRTYSKIPYDKAYSNN